MTENEEYRRAEIVVDLAAVKRNVEVLSEAVAADADGPVSRIAGIGRPRMARAWRSNSERFCEIEVTMPVSCGLGESSEKTASSPRTKNSTPKMP